MSADGQLLDEVISAVAPILYVYIKKVASFDICTARSGAFLFPSRFSNLLADFPGTF